MIHSDFLQVRGFDQAAEIRLEKDLAPCVVDSVFTIHHNVDSHDRTSRPSWIQKAEEVEQKCS